MKKFLRFLVYGREETETEFQARMQELYQDMHELSLKQPEEVAGDPLEGVY